MLFAYLAALNLLDAEVLFSDIRVKDLLDPAVTAPRAVERHHLFPKKHLASLGISGTRQVNAIANMAFLDWAENAKISDADSLDYWPIMTARVNPDRHAHQVRCHALPVGWEQLDYQTFLERRRTLIARVVREGFATLWGVNKPIRTPSVEDLIEAGESQTLEFKSTARWNIHMRQHDPRMEHSVVKTVCGLLNAEGGSLLIGVNDEGKLLGLDDDLGTLGSNSNADGYELFLRQLLDTNLSVITAATVRIRFHRVEACLICQVVVAPSGKPVFAKPSKGGVGNGSEFWVRIGNAAKQMHGDDMVHYQEVHWC